MIPERNGISRLDEMMSGVARVDVIIEWFIYSYSYNSYVLQIVDVTRLSFRVELTARCCCAVFYSQLTSKVIHARLVQAVVYFERHVVSFEYFVSLYNRNNRFYIMPPRFQRFI
jgi:hypothetical protein